MAWGKRMTEHENDPCTCGHFRKWHLSGDCTKSELSVPVNGPPKEPEAVNHPAHYGGKDDPYEAIKVIEAWQLGFNLGNTVKYISRAGKKPGSSTLQDLRKAAFYLAREISNLETEPKK
jgi:hypothetical protein